MPAGWIYDGMHAHRYGPQDMRPDKWSYMGVDLPELPPGYLVRISESKETFTLTGFKETLTFDVADFENIPTVIAQILLVTG